MTDCAQTVKSCFWGHAWGRWKVMERVNIVRRDDKSIIGDRLVQERACERCGYTQLDKQRVLL